MKYITELTDGVARVCEEVLGPRRILYKRTRLASLIILYAVLKG